MNSSIESVDLEYTPVLEVVTGAEQKPPKEAITIEVATGTLGAEELLAHVQLAFPNRITALPDIVGNDVAPVHRALGRQDIITWMQNYIEGVKRRHNRQK